MLRYLLLVLSILCLGENLYCQAVQGKIVDARTQAPLPYVNVFINNTTIGTTTNEKGEYLLPVPLGQSEIIFSFVGYESAKAKVTVHEIKTVKLDIQLVPSKQELQTVEVNSTVDKSWQKLYKQFQKVFLGETNTASQCRILNPWVVNLVSEKRFGKNVLTASSSQAIEIENLALGYKIFYDLQLLLATNENYRFGGFVHFVDLETTDSIQAAKWTKNRLDAYRGSSRHFFKSILDRRVAAEGFSVFSYKPLLNKDIKRSAIFSQDLDKVVKAYDLDKIYIDTLSPGKFGLPIEKGIEIHYNRLVARNKTYVDITAPVAGLEFTAQCVELNDQGVILNPLVMTTTGYMSISRMADVLPYDYTPERQQNFVRIKPITLDDAMLEVLREKVYLHTDKSYYYPGDMIWFKGYLKYHSAQLFDSLSAALYVDLIGPAHKVLQTKIFQIDSGRVSGDISLPATLDAGDYYLRAYTNWMRNYPGEDLFIKPVPVLGVYENFETTNKPPEDQAKSRLQIEIKPDRKNYAPHDSISVTISIRDEFDNAVAADLSIAVTDTRAAIPVPEEVTIVGKFNTPDSSTRISKKELLYPAEKGISISGQFKNEKGKPKKARLTIVQGHLDDLAEIDTDELGNFWITGFQFFDTTSFGFQAVNAKRKKLYGKVWLNVKVPPPVPDTLPFLSAGLKKQTYKNRYVAQNNEEDARLLQEVVIEGTKIEDKTRSVPRIGFPDVSLGEDYFDNTPATDLMDAIQRKVPGLRLLWAEGGYTVVIGFISSVPGATGSGSGSIEPLLIIDGIPDHSPGRIMDKIAMIPPRIVKRVEVYKYGSGAIYGTRGANGVIAIYTKNGESAVNNTKGFDRKLFQLETVQGFTEARKFEAPVYGKKSRQSDQPDFRATVYWQPWLKTSSSAGTASVFFYAADMETTYRIVVEGVSSTGEAIHAEEFIKISN